jgi:hypothetical protein
MALNENLMPYPKVTKVVEGITQVIECLPTKLKALSSVPSTTKKKKK